MNTWERHKAVRQAYLAKKHEESSIIECACGCGETFREIGKNGRKHKYVSGHNRRKYPHGSDSHTERRKRLMEESITVLCACGCGSELKSVNKHGMPVKYLHGHRPSEKYQTKEEKASQSKIRYRDNKIKAIHLLGDKCTECGIPYDNKNAAIFHFHHIDPSKKESILARKFTGNFEKALEELKKCVLVCANCHIMLHNEYF